MSETTGNPKKKYRLTVGEGDDKIEIGEVEIETLPNGHQLANILIDNAQILGELGIEGGMFIKGIMPAPNWKDNT